MSLGKVVVTSHLFEVLGNALLHKRLIFKRYRGSFERQGRDVERRTQFVKCGNDVRTGDTVAHTHPAKPIRLGKRSQVKDIVICLDKLFGGDRLAGIFKRRILHVSTVYNNQRLTVYLVQKGFQLCRIDRIACRIVRCTDEDDLRLMLEVKLVELCKIVFTRGRSHDLCTDLFGIDLIHREGDRVHQDLRAFDRFGMNSELYDLITSGTDDQFMFFDTELLGKCGFEVHHGVIRIKCHVGNDVADRILNFQ